MHKTVMTMLVLLPATATFAGEASSEQVNQERDEWTKRYFASQGAAVPDGGVTVLPEKQMSEFNTFKEERAKSKASIQKHGYIQAPSPEAQTLMNFKTVSQKQLTSNGSANSANEGLHRSISEIQMAYSFHGVPAYEITKDLGVAPSVTYVKDKGWAGASQFFEKNNVGICSYRENNLKFSHGSAVISEESSTRDVNGKVTVAAVTGEEGSGFTYNVNWYDKYFFRELNCANEVFSPDIVRSVLKLAQSIDRNG